MTPRAVTLVRLALFRYSAWRLSTCVRWTRRLTIARRKVRFTRSALAMPGGGSSM